MATGPMSWEKSAGDKARLSLEEQNRIVGNPGSESCKAPGMAHKARNCTGGGCAETGHCAYKPVSVVETAREMGLLRPAQPIALPPSLRQIDVAKAAEVLSGSALPTDKQARKDTPICSGVLDYFTAALAEIARVSKAGNDQHNPGQPLHWARGKSMDHADCIVRHLIERGTIDTDGMRHSAKMAWRALALLQQELEDEGAPLSRASKVME